MNKTIFLPTFLCFRSNYDSTKVVRYDHVATIVNFSGKEKRANRQRTKYHAYSDFTEVILQKVMYIMI